MKRIQPLVLAISVGLALCFSAASVTGAEETKKEEAKNSEPAKRKTFKEKMFDVGGMDEEEEVGKPAKKVDVVQQYPLAARSAPSQDGEPAVAKLRNQMIVAYQKNKDDDANAAAEKLKADPRANINDKAVATQVGLIILSRKDAANSKAIIPLIEEILELNALDNNTHFSMMSELSQRYLMEQDYEDALATADRFMRETKTETKVALLVRGNALYRLKQLPESIAALEKVKSMDPGNTQAIQMLARAYADNGQTAKAIEINQGLVQTAGNDKATLVNLAISLRDTKELDKAADIIADLRKNNQLTDERDFLTAVNIYTGIKNREKDTIEIIEQGLQKGALKGDANIYNVLAEAYYYSDVDNNVVKAIENWEKAAPLAKNGSPYLNLSIVQCQEEMWSACKESAKKAISKGGINAGDAKTQIVRADKGLSNSK